MRLDCSYIRYCAVQDALNGLMSTFFCLSTHEQDPTRKAWRYTHREMRSFLTAPIQEMVVHFVAYDSLETRGWKPRLSSQ